MSQPFDEHQDLDEEEDRGFAFRLGRAIAVVLVPPLLLAFLALALSFVALLIAAIGWVGWAMPGS